MKISKEFLGHQRKTREKREYLLGEVIITLVNKPP